ncbi:DUF6541 family protein [Paraconexibacter algicola]|uniref:Glycosyltransferase RgtA/B/C/D-like domain-containing protein n=1 Tax=Paraconexibacter algicola TaxID=2133960 RepID=A0A2T4UC58_9ACTN|nr:DUF6541 family protein [Paraconexibacter algicola]PTL54815.1 hypothetical protein C7Y72_19705 [Paraconexibacter algicola]
MALTVDQPTIPPIPEQDGGEARRWPRRLTWASFVVAPALMAWSYSIAATSPADDQLHYSVFWLGMLSVLLPVGARLLSPAPGRDERLLLVIATGLVLYVPKFLRETSGIVFHDEFAHARQVQLITDNGRLGDLNPLIQIVQSFPGLHSITATLQEVSGIGQPATIALLIGLLHAFGLVGLFLLAESVSGSSRIGALAGFLYTVNASYLYFDAQFSYESLSLPLLFWTLVCVDRARRSIGDRGACLGWCGLAITIGGGLVVTHHLTAYVLCMLLLGVTVVGAVRALRGRAAWPPVRLTFALFVVATSACVFWGVVRAPLVKQYLEPRITQGFSQLFDIASRNKEGRELFAQSTLPTYERVLGFLVAPIALVATLGGLWLVWQAIRRRRERLDDMHLTFVGLGLLYLPSFPLLLSVAGNEGARRSWATSYIGLVVLVSPAVVHLWDRHRRRPGRPPGPPGRRRRPRPLVVGAALGAAFTASVIGNTAIGLNETYRFPGPYVYGSDTRSVTPELVDFSRNLDDTYGPGNRVVGDRYTTLLTGTIGRQSTSRPSAGFPVWQMYFDPFPTDALLNQLKGSEWKFLVVDRQMGLFTPRIGVYFEPDEPLAQIRTEPPSPEFLDKYERLPFTLKVSQSDNLNLYRFDFGALDAQRAGLR